MTKRLTADAPTLAWLDDLEARLAKAKAERDCMDPGLSFYPGAPAEQGIMRAAQVVRLAVALSQAAAEDDFGEEWYPLVALRAALDDKP